MEYIPTNLSRQTCKPVSSKTSRTAVVASGSPSSAEPPGKHQTSKSSRLVNKIWPSLITATIAPIEFIRLDPVWFDTHITEVADRITSTMRHTAFKAYILSGFPQHCEPVREVF